MTKMIGTPGSTHAQVDGIDYNIDDEGFFTIENGEHVVLLRKMGFRSESDPVLVTSLEGQYPNMCEAARDFQVDMTHVTTEKQLVAGIESSLAARRARREADVQEDELVEAAPFGESTITAADSASSTMTGGQGSDTVDFDKDMNREQISAWLAERGVTMAATLPKPELVAAAVAKQAGQ